MHGDPKSERGLLFGLVLLTLISPQTENFLDIINLFSLDNETTLCLSSLFVSQESSQISKNKESTTESFLKSINEEDNGQSTVCIRRRRDAKLLFFYGPTVLKKNRGHISQTPIEK